MKELSIEEKAQRYDEAIKKAESLYKAAEPMSGCNVIIETLFPELKESEDEKIRKEMIFYFTKEIPQCSIQEHSDKMREFISWLERQEVERTKLELKAGNSYFCYKSRWERADNETFKKGLIYKCNKDGVLDNFVIKNPEQHFIEIKNERIAWLEKQGEQKETLCDKCRKEQPSHSCQDITALGRCYIEGIKKSNIVEPKFKNGEWIVWQDKCYKVNDNSCGYELVDQNGLSTSLEYGTIDENAHLWDITKDAKDGDVLCYKDEISLYKHDIKNCTKQKTTFGGFVYHCCYDGKGFVVDSLYSLTEQDKMDILPATKEQRDQLEKAMAEAGYTFDFVKKELRKIEQKSADKLELKKIEWNDCKTCGFRTLAYKQNTAWSEEDENVLEDIEEAIINYWHGDTQDILLDWLKSLRPQPHWKPSDEQMEALYLAAMRGDEPKYTFLVKLYNDLKKLSDK